MLPAAAAVVVVAAFAVVAVIVVVAAAVAVGRTFEQKCLFSQRNLVFNAASVFLSSA